MLIVDRQPRIFTSEDIYSRLNEVATETAILPRDLTILSVSSSWINQDRLPMVTAIRDYENGNIIFSQVSRTPIEQKAYFHSQGQTYIALFNREYIPMDKN